MKKIRILFSLLFLFVIGLGLASCGNSIKDFNFDNNYLTLSEGETKKSTQIDNSSKVITYFSSDETVATVDENGNVTGRGAGDAVIYALFENKPYKCYIKVNKKEITPEVCEKEALLDLSADSIPLLGSLAIKLPIKMKHNTHDSLICLDENLKIQLEVDLLKAPETKDGDTVKVTSTEQVVNNLKTISLLSALINTDKNPTLANFKKVITDYASQVTSASDKEAKIKELGDVTVYAYLSNSYLSVAILSKGELKAYAYSDNSNGIISKLKSLIQTINQFTASGTDLQKVDYIELAKNMTGDLLTPEIIESLKKYQNLVSLAAYLVLGEIQVNKSTIEEGKVDQRLTITVSENGLNKTNDMLATKSQIFAAIKLKSLNAIVDVTKDEKTNYNHFKYFGINVMMDAAGLDIPLTLKITLGTDSLSKEEKPFKYEEKHSEFEKVKFETA